MSHRNHHRKFDGSPSDLSNYYRLIVIVLLTSFTATVIAQTAPAQRPGVRKPAEDPALKPRREILTTKDNVKINAFYFPSKEGKKAVPVIVVHEWKGQAGPYMKLFLALRQAGFAIVALEYRGHGTSKTYTDERGVEKDYNIATMGRNDVQAIIQKDIEEVKQFMKGENNAGRLNLNALSLIGIGEGAIMAGYWASLDWKIPSVGRMKQGQDVKALVYVSPEKNLNGLAMAAPLQDPNLVRLPTLIIAGSRSPQGREAEKLGSRLETVKKRFSRGMATGYELFMPSTNLSGAALINDEAAAIPKIVTFLKENVDVDDTANEWIDRP